MNVITKEKVYVASSWKNELQPTIVRALKSLGHEVYDFRNPPNKSGFGWEQVMSYKLGDKVSVEEYRKGLNHPIAKAGYNSDIQALEWCTVVVYVLPCGRSASWEFGYAMGQGKKGYVVITEDIEPDLMFMEAKLITNLGELLSVFSE